MLHLIRDPRGVAFSSTKSRRSTRVERRYHDGRNADLQPGQNRRSMGHRQRGVHPIGSPRHSNHETSVTRTSSLSRSIPWLTSPRSPGCPPPTCPVTSSTAALAISARRCTRSPGNPMRFGGHHVTLRHDERGRRVCLVPTAAGLGHHRTGPQVPRVLRPVRRSSVSAIERDRCCPRSISWPSARSRSAWSDPACGREAT